MAEAADPIKTEWGPAWLHTYYDEGTERVTRFRYGNASIRPEPGGNAVIEVYRRVGNNDTPIWTQIIPPGTPEQEVIPTTTIALDPTTGEFDKWSIRTRGPGT